MLRKTLLLFLLLLSVQLVVIANGNTGKPKYLWFDASANFERFATKDSISYYLEKAKSVGFNQIVVDVKPNCGEVLYESKILPPLISMKGKVIHRDWDYLQFFIDEAHRLQMKVTVSTAVFPSGKPGSREGTVYKDSCWKGKTCIEYNTNQTFSDIKNNPAKVGAFLNPVRADVQEFALEVVREIVGRYDIDGYALDYCRFPDDKSDFSEYTRNAFETYLGKKVENFPEDVFTWNPDGTKKTGKYFNEWWAFRANVISSFVKSVRKEIHKINKNVKLEYWAASWIHGIYGQGQNWASPKSDFSLKYEWGSPAYNATGFAPYLDVFMCGTYLNRIYGMEDAESIEFGLERAKKLVGNDCSVYGTIYALNHKENIADAVDLCLQRTGGLMVFDIVQVIEMDLWDGIRKGIQSAESVVADKIQY